MTRPRRLSVVVDDRMFLDAAAISREAPAGESDPVVGPLEREMLARAEGGITVAAAPTGAAGRRAAR